MKRDRREWIGLDFVGSLLYQVVNVKVVLAEKPSVARDLARVLGAATRRDGYLEGNGYQVTWAFGHLVTLKEPDDYDPSLKRWSLEALPIIPATFELKLAGDEGAQRQFRVIEKLVLDADELICATDAGREGELIFRYILEMSGCQDRPFQRLWLSSLTEAAIRSAFDSLAPGADYDNLYAAARCRSEADWIIGMNATRNFTVRYGKSGVLWSVGRVQTPVLALIVDRDEEIRHFDPEPWFEVRTRYRKVLFKFRGDRFKKESDAQELLAGITGVPFEITAVRKKDEQERPPQLFDLTALQRDMNVRYGMSAANVLKEAQALYESKLITYPRTDSRYLTNDMREELITILRRLGETHDAVASLDLDNLPKDKRIFDDKKVTDHHAILPTGRDATRSGGPAKQIHDAIVLRTIAAFYPPCRKEVTTVEGLIAAHEFRARGVRVIDPGWTSLYPKKRNDKNDKPTDDADDDKQELPAFTVGDGGSHEPDMKSGETRPPRHYNENSLLAAMETAGRLVEDEELRDALKARGLGTPATRAAIIETLLRRRYIRRDKKALLATDLGRYLIALIQNPILKSPEMTGEWEARLHEIEAGGRDAASFMSEIEKFTRDVIDGSDRDRLDHDGIGPCPKCGGDIVEGRRGFGCSKWRDGCDYVLWKEYEGHTIPQRQARELIQRRISLRPVQLAGEAVVLALNGEARLTHIAMPQREHQRDAKPPKARPVKRPSVREPKTESASTCPLCASRMVEKETSYSCAAWRTGCSFAIEKKIAGKKISKAMARKLLTKGRTQVLKGFTSKSNKPFAARLKLEDGRVRFELES